MGDKAPVLAPFHITDNDGNITNGSTGSTGVFSDVWKYQVPQGTGIILQSGDQFSLYLSDDSSPTEVGQTDCIVRIEVRDPAESDTRKVFGDTLYKRCREMEDRNLIARLQLAAPVKVFPRQWIVIVAKDVGTIEPPYSYFDLLTSKVAVPL